MREFCAPSPLWISEEALSRQGEFRRMTIKQEGENLVLPLLFPA